MRCINKPVSSNVVFQAESDLDMSTLAERLGLIILFRRRLAQFRTPFHRCLLGDFADRVLKGKINCRFVYPDLPLSVYATKLEDS
jgi:hypothetical protein